MSNFAVDLLKANIVAPFVLADGSTLAGHDEYHVHVSLDRREAWVNGIFHNSRAAIFALRVRNSHLELEQIYRADAPKFRKRKVASLAVAAAKIQEWVDAALGTDAGGF